MLLLAIRLESLLGDSDDTDGDRSSFSVISLSGPVYQGFCVLRSAASGVGMSLNFGNSLLGFLDDQASDMRPGAHALVWKHGRLTPRLVLYGFQRKFPGTFFELNDKILRCSNKMLEMWPRHFASQICWSAFQSL